LNFFSLGVTAEDRAATDWKSAFLKQWGQFSPKFQVGRVVLTNFFSVRKLGAWAFYTVEEFRQKFISFIAIHAFDRRTDGNLVDDTAVHCSMQRDKNAGVLSVRANAEKLYGQQIDVTW